jgi:hypothetical protein
LSESSGCASFDGPERNSVVTILVRAICTDI